MRDIIFRGKREDNGEWVEGDLLRYESGEMAIHSGFSRYGYEAAELFGRNKVIPETVCQYTGLTDKNDRKIFEGDIIRYGDGLYRVVFEQRNGTAYFGIAISEIETWYFGNNVPAKQMEVIGNIYDNPELLEVCNHG